MDMAPGSVATQEGAMDTTLVDQPQITPVQPADLAYKSVSGTYVGRRGLQRLELRLDLQEKSLHGLHQPLNLVSGDLYFDTGDGQCEYRSSFIVEHPYATWDDHEVAITGTMVNYVNLEPASPGTDAGSAPILRVTIRYETIDGAAACATVEIVRWGNYRTTYECERTSVFLRTIDLEIDRITGTALPRPLDTQAVAGGPAELPPLSLDIQSAYQRAGIDMRIVSDEEVVPPVDAGDDLKWDEDELHNAMAHNFSQWRDQPQWKLYLLIATHFRLYPQQMVTGIMYDSEYRDPNDRFPRQGAAAFYSTMEEAWAGLSGAEFDRSFLRTCVHELGHALNLLHTFDKDRPDSTSWMNYPWRYPYGYNLPPGWDGTDQFWQKCRFEFDPEELRHLRHHSMMEIIPGGAAFGAMGHDVAVPAAIPAGQLETAPLALYIRTRPERALFSFAEPVTVELKLKNQTGAAMVVPDMLNPEFGLLELFILDPRGQVHAYQPLFRLCGEPRMAKLPPGEKLYESVFVAYGARGFYFEQPGEYQIWAAYSAGGLRLRSNTLRIRVSFPQTPTDEEIALRTFGHEQGHVLYMHGAGHLQSGNDQLREIAERFPDTNLARYIHLCFGRSEARAFKDLVARQMRPARPQVATAELEKAVSFPPRASQSALDNITHGRAVDLLFDLYRETDRPERAKKVLTDTARYFERMEVKPEVVSDFQNRARAIPIQDERSI
jgi:hypothetical protein